MKKKLMLGVLSLGFIFAAGAGSTLAAPPEKVDGFVCPVFNENSKAGEKNPNAVRIGGVDYSIIGPEVRVPVNATNDNGAGTPGGLHASPGESTYTAIWGVEKG